MGSEVRQFRMWTCLRARWFGGLLALSVVGGAAAGTLDDGVAAYQRGDYATAMRLLRPLADQGNPDAQFNLGMMCAHGHGAPQDYGEAVKWYRKAADQGFGAAWANLGEMHANGQGVPQDYAQAAKLFRTAATRGNGAAQNGLGVLYLMG
jgi:TPR repeat protein